MQSHEALLFRLCVWSYDSDEAEHTCSRDLCSGYVCGVMIQMKLNIRAVEISVLVMCVELWFRWSWTYVQSRSLFWLCVWSYDSDEAEHTCGRDLCSGYVCGVMIQMKLNIRAVEISVPVMCVELWFRWSWTYVRSRSLFWLCVWSYDSDEAEHTCSRDLCSGYVCGVMIQMKLNIRAVEISVLVMCVELWFRWSWTYVQSRSLFWLCVWSYDSDEAEHTCSRDLCSGYVCGVMIQMKLNIRAVEISVLVMCVELWFRWSWNIRAVEISVPVMCVELWFRWSWTYVQSRSLFWLCVWSYDSDEAEHTCRSRSLFWLCVWSYDSDEAEHTCSRDLCSGYVCGVMIQMKLNIRAVEISVPVMCVELWFRWSWTYVRSRSLFRLCVWSYDSDEAEHTCGRDLCSGYVCGVMIQMKLNIRAVEISVLVMCVELWFRWSWTYVRSRSLFWLCVWSYDSDEAEHTCGRDLCSGYVCGVMIQMKLNIRAVEISVLVMCVELWFRWSWTYVQSRSLFWLCVWSYDSDEAEHTCSRDLCSGYVCGVMIQMKLNIRAVEISVLVMCVELWFRWSWTYVRSRSLFWLCVWSYDSDEAEHTCGRDLCSGYVCGVMIQMKLNIRAVEISVLVMCVELWFRWSWTYVQSRSLFCIGQLQKFIDVDLQLRNLLLLHRPSMTPCIYHLIIIIMKMKDVAPETLLMQSNSKLQCVKLRNDVGDARAVRVRLLKSRRKYHYDKDFRCWMP